MESAKGSRGKIQVFVHYPSFWTKQKPQVGAGGSRRVLDPRPSAELVAAVKT
jgi:hypothetical protein